MMMQSGLRALLLVSIAAFCLVGTSVLAEVAVRTDRYGNYVMTKVVPTGPDWNPNVWTSRSRNGRRANALNPLGDMNGDLWPEVEESSGDDRHPWVVWSKNDGQNYQLAWSRWNLDGWEEIQWVDLPSDWDELGPDMKFDRRGRPYLVWYRDEGGQGKVLFSMFLQTRWMEPVVISTPEVDARDPRVVRILNNGRINISYETSEGTYHHVVEFDEPVTITDDINPQTHFTIDTQPTYIRPN